MQSEMAAFFGNYVQLDPNTLKLYKNTTNEELFLN